jgi:hypothetical protein
VTTKPRSAKGTFAPSPKDEPVPNSTPDQWVSEKSVCAELNVTRMTTWRYDRDRRMTDLGWPPPIKLNTHIFRSRTALDTFKANLARLALTRRDTLLREAEQGKPKTTGRFHRAKTTKATQRQTA